MSLLFVGLHLNLMSIGYVKSSILWNFGLSLRDNNEWHWIMVCLMWLSPVWMIKECSWTNILLFSRHADSHCELCFVKVINVLSCVCRWMMWWWLVMILWYLVHQILHSRYLVLHTELCKRSPFSGCLLSFDQGHWACYVSGPNGDGQSRNSWLFWFLLLTSILLLLHLVAAWKCYSGDLVGCWYACFSCLIFGSADMESICQWWGVHSNVSAAFWLCHITCICPSGRTLHFFVWLCGYLGHLYQLPSTVWLVFHKPHPKWWWGAPMLKLVLLTFKILDGLCPCNRFPWWFVIA